MYQALYRKYRPLNFENVVGQNVIVNTLKNAIVYNRISHAYLFSGPRGTGKTTIAKIFARSVNCLNPVEGLACGKCKNCLYSYEKECMDIIEIDAASNNGVDEIRELRSKVNILPSELKYKVYIIDEVHMLSIGAFNALLKTIEEPPEHVIFILATTDPQKIPSTIISRCQWYTFKKINNNDIVNRLRDITQNENIEIDNDVLEKIAESSDGGLRDAIGLLDKLRAYAPSKISINDFYEINGQINDDELRKMEKFIFSNDIKNVLYKIEQYYQDGKNLVQILKQLMLLIKNELFEYYVDSKNIVINENVMVDFLNLLNNELVNIKKSDDVKLSVEVCLLHYMDKLNEDNGENKNKSNSIVNNQIKREQIKKIETIDINKKNIKKTNQYIETENFKIKKIKEIMLIRAKNTMIAALKKELDKENSIFIKFNDYTFDQDNGYLACELLDGTVRASSEENLILSYGYESMIENIFGHFDKIKEFYNEISKNNKNISIITDDDWNTLKNEYIKLRKEGKHFDYQEEPNLNIILKNDKIIADEENDSINEAKKLFGDVVEIKED